LNTKAAKEREEEKPPEQDERQGSVTQRKRLESGTASSSRSSDPYFSLQPAFAPKSPPQIKITKIAGRGEVGISQLPTLENHETLSVHLDDAPLEYQGAAWYEVIIEWQ